MTLFITRDLRDNILEFETKISDPESEAAPVPLPLSRGAFDRVIAISAIIFFLPFYMLVSLILLIGEGRPLLFRQLRIGRNGRHFTCLKFRTMAPNADKLLSDLLDRDPEAKKEWAQNQKLAFEPIICCVGLFLRKTGLEELPQVLNVVRCEMALVRFLRKSSLDELPQFWNVVRGEMALVGPRPIIDDEIRHYGEHFKDYISVKPGITGHWQVNGRSTTTYQQRVDMDVDYIRNRSRRRDIGILFKTVRVVLTGHGAS